MKADAQIDPMKKLYVRIAKTAGTSLSSVLKNEDRIIETSPSLKHKKLFQRHKYDFRFTFVRNPYDRIVSSYKMLTQSKIALGHYQALDHSEIIGISFNEFIKKVIDIRNNIGAISIKKADGIHLHPSRFGRSFLKSRRLAYEYYWILAHTESMTDSVEFISPLSEINFIGRYESLEKDYDDLIKALNLGSSHGASPLPRLNVSEQRKKYTEYYDKESFELVSMLYEKDLSNFGYKFD